MSLEQYQTFLAYVAILPTLDRADVKFQDADDAAQPMALFVLSANFGPSLGSPIGEWIAEDDSLGWRWSMSCFLASPLTLRQSAD